MSFPSADLVSAVYQLLPGFITAWIFYSLTAHPKKSPFERTIQALIFTAIIKLLVLPLSWSFIWLGSYGWTIGVWNQDTSFIVSAFFAIALGFLFSYFANTGILHANLFPLISATKRTSHPSEWFSAFNEDKCFIYLHFKDGRRLFGWPYEWPDHPDEGHFVILRPEWILEDNQRAPLSLTLKMLIPAKQVRMVEFEKDENDPTYDLDQLQKSTELLLNLRKDDDE
ncbi:hypothetical protein Pan241w_26170 [Gimesia alba]|uniref:Uncharacterized protein n=1 Tax=Gimesia alba TaxID=2527973 RepID=A0A517RF77_9PLAN|nr:DUF6338 family protein [Gimesia alba]QDT42532.1 hypothetical protein Pan241w_26170 [Gimesia alba]